MRRINNGLIEEYLRRIVPHSKSPANFHFWSIATAVGATLKRACWVKNGTYKVYPNMYTILVGMPGCGKGTAMNPAVEIMHEAQTVNFLSDSVTPQYVYEKLAKGWVVQTPQGANGTAPTAAQAAAMAGPAISTTMEHSALIYAPELPVLLRKSKDAIDVYTDLWDGREIPRQYATRHFGQFTTEKACVSLLAGISPAGLIETLPSKNVAGGFARRTNFVYTKDLNFKKTPSPPLDWKDDFVQVLRYIGTHVKGEYGFAADAQKLFDEFEEGTQILEFDDDLTAQFKTTQATHVLKLSMAIAACRRDVLRIDKGDVEDAILNVELNRDNLLYVFRAIGEADLVVATDKVLKYIEDHCKKVGTGVTWGQIHRAVGWRCATKDQLTTIMDTLQSSQAVSAKMSGNQLVYNYIGSPINCTHQPMHNGGGKYSCLLCGIPL